jgi:hypothetical protein
MTACGHYNCAWMHGIQFEQWWVCKACGKILWLASPEAAALRLAVLGATGGPASGRRREAAP